MEGSAGGWWVNFTWFRGGTYVCSLNFKYGNMVLLYFEELTMPLSVFNPSLCCLLPFHLVLCRCFKAMSLVGILS